MMRVTVPFLFAFFFQALVPRLQAQDAIPPEVEIVGSEIAVSPTSKKDFRILFYVNATDETALASYDALEYRAQIDGVITGGGAWKTWPFSPTLPVQVNIGAKVKSLFFEVRSRDAAGNYSESDSLSLQAPFTLAPKPRLPKYAKASNSATGGVSVETLEARFDLDGDGTPDVVQADHDSGLLRIRRNVEGDGTGLQNVDIALPAGTLDGAAAGLLSGKADGDDNDELADLAVAVGGKVRIYRNQGAASGNLVFLPQTSALEDAAYYLRHVAVADLNGDGHDDVIATAEALTGSASKVAVFLNTSDTAGGTFAAPVFYDLTNLPVALAVGDLNDDGAAELIVGETNGWVEALVNDGDGAFAPAVSTILYGEPRSLAVGDLTGDGRAELVVGAAQAYFGNTYADAYILALAEDETRLDEIDQLYINAAETSAPEAETQVSVAVADVNVDGQLDVIGASDLSHLIKVFTFKPIATSAGDFFVFAERNIFTVTGGAYVRRLVVGDLDENGLPDLLTANEYPTIQASVLINTVPAGLTSAPKSFKVAAKDGAIAGYPFYFSTVLAAEAPNLKLTLQYAFTADGPWGDIGTLTRAGSKWSLTAHNLPPGAFFFRVLATADGFTPQPSNVSGPLTIAPANYEGDLRVAEVKTEPKLKISAASVNRTLKVPRGGTAIFGLVVGNPGSRNTFKIAGSASESGGKVRALYSTKSDFSDDITAAVTAGTFQTPPITHGQTYTLFMKVKPDSTATDGTGVPFAVSAVSDGGAAPRPFSGTTAIVIPIAPKNTFFVLNTDDGGAGSLRDAIVKANSVKAPVVKFELPASSFNGGVATITPAQLLPVVLSAGTVLDGKSAREHLKFLGASSGAALVKIRSSYLEFGAGVSGAQAPLPTGLSWQLSGGLIERIWIEGFIVGLHLEGDAAKKNVVRGCVFTVNQEAGVRLSAGATDNLIGGSTSDHANLTGGYTTLQGLGAVGIDIRHPGTRGNKVQGNRIGIGLPGYTGHSCAGITIRDGAQGNLIGGTSLERRNVIAYSAQAPSGELPEVPLAGVAIFGVGTEANLVQGNLIGTDESGAHSAPNTTGIALTDGASRNLIGGSDPGAGNVISGNEDEGISIGTGLDSEKTLSGNRIAGNTIGLEHYGNDPLGNGTSGILIWGNVEDTVIGGPTAASRNVISGNAEYGIDLFKGKRTVIQNNWIGIAASGLAAAGNGYSGIAILFGEDSLIGGDGATLAKAKDSTQTRGNVIAHNGGTGVNVSIGKRNTIRGNAIYSNAKLGIDIARDSTSNEDGPNANDALDADTGANDLQNFPNVTDARVLKIGGKFVTTVSGGLQSLPNPGAGGEKNSFVIDFYSSYNADPSGFGEGDTWLGATEVVTDASGNAIFQVDLTGDYRGRFITATATRQQGTGSKKSVESTSEFSGTRIVTPPPF